MSQTSSPIQSDRRERGDLPTWLVVLVLLLCVGGGGALVWWYFTAPPARVVAIPLPTQQPGRANGGPGGNRQQRNVDDWNFDVRSANNGFQARAGSVQMWVRQRQGAEATLNIFYRQQLLPPEQIAILRAPVLATRDDQIQRLKLTPEQVTKLKAIRPLRGVKMTDDEQKSVRDAWAAFAKAAPADQNGPKGTLLALLASLGTKNLDSTKAALAENVAAIRAVLTPEQQKLLESGQ